MAIILKNSKIDITIDSKTIIGFMGQNYDKFIKSLNGDDIFILDNRISNSNKRVSSLLEVNDKVLDTIKELELNENILNKKVSDLSHSEQKLLKYLLLIINNKKLNIIDEPFMDLDFFYKKKIIVLLNELVKKNKTIIVGSSNSNIIYSLCKKILLIREKDYFYGNIDSLENKRVLKKYNIVMPDLVNFVNLAKEKKVKLRYSYDIRDLIKDVYRNVSKK